MGVPRVRGRRVGRPVTKPSFTIQPNGTIKPAEGFEWCPYCDGAGEVTSMSVGPDLDESTTECGFCDGGIREAR